MRSPSPAAPAGCALNRPAPTQAGRPRTRVAPGCPAPRAARTRDPGPGRAPRLRRAPAATAFHSRSRELARRGAPFLPYMRRDRGQAPGGRGHAAGRGVPAAGAPWPLRGRRGRMRFGRRGRLRRPWPPSPPGRRDRSRRPMWQTPLAAELCLPTTSGASPPAGTAATRRRPAGRGRSKAIGTGGRRAARRRRPQRRHLDHVQPVRADEVAPASYFSAISARHRLLPGAAQPLLEHGLPVAGSHGRPSLDPGDRVRVVGGGAVAFRLVRVADLSGQHLRGRHQRPRRSAGVPATAAGRSPPGASPSASPSVMVAAARESRSARAGGRRQRHRPPPLRLLLD